MNRRTLLLPVALAAAISLTACGEEVQPIPLDSVAAAPPSTESSTTTPVLRTTVPEPVTTDGVGETWVDATGNLAGLSSECGNLSYVSVNPEGELIASVALQGLWSSDDSGESWTQLGEAAGSDALELRTTAIVHDPLEPKRFWVSGQYDTGGIYETSNGGASFRQLLEGWNTVGVSVDLGNPDRNLLLAALEPMELQRSTDGGTTWESFARQLPDEGGRIVAALAVDSQTYLVGTRDGRVPGIFRSADGGATWSRVHPTGVAGVPVRANDGTILWLAERGGGVLLSEDDGATWRLNDGRGISPFAASLVQLSDGRLTSVSDGALIMSSDLGKSWRQFGPALPYEPSGLKYSPTEGAFYVWRSDCEWDSDNPVRPGAIMRLAFDGASSEA
jgi:photosystem II stability/assembly factor-like uncharacterized protein